MRLVVNPPTKTTHYSIDTKSVLEGQCVCVCVHFNISSRDFNLKFKCTADMILSLPFDKKLKTNPAPTELKQ